MQDYETTLHINRNENCFFSSSAQKSLEEARTRLMMVMVSFVVCFSIITLRIVNLSVFTAGPEPRDSSIVAADRSAGRADITDRQGIILATSVHTASLYAIPKRILDLAEAVQKLKSVFPSISEKTLKEKLTSPKSFVWLKRNLTPAEHAQTLKLGLPGLEFSREEKRIYPQGSTTSHVIGLTDIDGHGIAGVENFFDAELRNSNTPLQLSIDTRAQHIVREELIKAVKHFDAAGANCIILDANTSEVVSMVSVPDFDPSGVNQAEAKQLFNTNTLAAQEMGSIFKILTVAMGVESGAVKMSNMYDARQPIKAAGFKINDFRGKKRWLSAPEVFIYSSNIGTVKMAQDMGLKYQRTFFKKMGLLSPTQIELAEKAMPQRPEVWRDINTLTMSYGYGLGVTPLQFTNSIASVVNGGVLRTPTLLKQTNPVEGERVLSEKTSDTMRRLLRLSVKRGTGRKANASGYLIGGKSGTANSQDGGVYVTKNANRSSFVGAFPIHKPKYVILVTLDKPQGTAETFGYSTGGWTAAPTTKGIVERIAPILGIQPIDENAPNIKNATYIDLHPKQAIVGRIQLTPATYRLP